MRILAKIASSEVSFSTLSPWEDENVGEGGRELSLLPL